MKRATTGGSSTVSTAVTDDWRLCAILGGYKAVGEALGTNGSRWSGRTLSPEKEGCGSVPPSSTSSPLCCPVTLVLLQLTCLPPPLRMRHRPRHPPHQLSSQRLPIPGRDGSFASLDASPDDDVRSVGSGASRRSSTCSMSSYSDAVRSTGLAQRHEKFVGDASDYIMKAVDLMAEHIPPGGSVLELGSRTGDSLTTLRCVVKRAGRVQGIALSEKGRARVVEQLTADGLKEGIEVHEGVLVSEVAVPQSMDGVLAPQRCMRHHLCRGGRPGPVHGCDAGPYAFGMSQHRSGMCLVCLEHMEHWLVVSWPGHPPPPPEVTNCDLFWAPVLRGGPSGFLP